MGSWLPDGLFVAGGLLFLLGMIRVGRLYPGLIRTMRSPATDRRAASLRRLEVAYTASKEAIVAGLGLTLNLSGLVLSSKTPAWVVWSGIVLTAASVLNVFTLRYVIRRQRDAA